MTTRFLLTIIGEFFIRKITKIRYDIDATVIESATHALVSSDAVVNSDQQLSTFLIKTESCVRDIIQRSAKKSCSLDPMATPL